MYCNRIQLLYLWIINYQIIKSITYKTIQKHIQGASFGECCLATKKTTGNQSWQLCSLKLSYESRRNRILWFFIHEKFLSESKCLTRLQVLLQIAESKRSSSFWWQLCTPWNGNESNENLICNSPNHSTLGQKAMVFPWPVFQRLWGLRLSGHQVRRDVTWIRYSATPIFQLYIYIYIRAVW